MIKFYISLIIELFSYPFNLLKKKKVITPKKKDLPSTDTLIFHIHEWTGYPFIRKKIIKYTNNEFNCGIKYSFEKIRNYTGVKNVRLILTISGKNYNKYVNDLKKQDFFIQNTEIYHVDNKAMDFSGYSFVAKNCLPSDKNEIIFFSNTSINKNNASFIDEYIKCFLENKEVGLLGVSFSSKCYQTLIRNNYTPHIQSFFFITTTTIIKEILSINNGDFPGEKECYKLGIIKFGEIKLSQLVLKLGYKLAFIDENGSLTILPSSLKNQKNIKEGDYRLFIKNPNQINEIKN